MCSCSGPTLQVNTQNMQKHDNFKHKEEITSITNNKEKLHFCPVWIHFSFWIFDVFLDLHLFLQSHKVMEVI